RIMRSTWPRSSRSRSGLGSSRFGGSRMAAGAAVVALTATLLALSAPIGNAAGSQTTQVPLPEFAEGITVDRADAVYVAGFNSGNIFKLPAGSTSWQTVPTLPLRPHHGSALGLAVDQNGNLYDGLNSFDKNNGVWQIRPDGSAKLYAAMPLTRTQTPW